jgi:hypothetical protein
MIDNFDLKLVDFDCNKNVNSFHFYPDRKFDAETIVILFRKETYGSAQYLNYFYECDKKNIKVNVFCTHNFFPLASLIGHSCYTEGAIKKHKGGVHRFDFLDPEVHLSKYCGGLIQFSEYRKELGIEHLLPVKYETMGFLDETPDYPVCQCSPSCPTARQHEKRLLENYMIKDDRVNELYDYFKNKPVYLSRQFFDYFMKIKDEFDSERICAEWKTFASPRAMALFQEFGSDKIINIDKKFVWDAVHKYELDQSYLSFQFLMCLYKNWRYASLGGAGNVAQTFYPINNLIVGDRENNIHPNAATLKIKLNKYFYGEEPIGITCERAHINPVTPHQWQKDRKIALNDLNEDDVDIVRNKILCYL